VDVRVEGVMNPERLDGALARSDAIHDELWAHVVTLARPGAPDGPTTALFISALNDVIDFHTSRVVVGTQYRIPFVIWMTLYALSVFAMAAVGFHFGALQAGRSVVTVVLAVAFSTVTFLILDLDRGSEGSIRVDQRPMLELQEKLHRGAR
jgi:hypothetical protein